MFKKLVASITLVVFLFVMVVPTYATTSYSSGSTKVMNSLNGLESAQSPITVSTYDTNAKASTVELNITVSKGSNPFYIIVKSPDGYVREKLVTASTKLTLTDFSGYGANGKWYVSIRTQGSSNTVATATATVKVNYTY